MNAPETIRLPRLSAEVIRDFLRELRHLWEQAPRRGPGDEEALVHLQMTIDYLSLALEERA
jgi:hypothetical protein